MLYITDIDAPWVGYTQAALQYQMSLLSVGFERWHFIPLRAAQNVRQEMTEMDVMQGTRLIRKAVPTMIGDAVQYRALPSWTEALQKPRMVPKWGTPEARIAIPEPQGYDLGVIHHTPDNVAHPDLRRGQKANLGLTVTETDRIPRWLAEQLNELDGVITASEFNSLAFQESGVTVPIHVLPHALGPYWLEPHPQDEVENDAYVFYYVGTWNERKNPADVVRAYLRAFPKNTGDTALMLKLHFTKGQERFLQAIVQAETGSVDRLGEGGDIWIYDQKLSWQEMRQLHAIGDCYVSLHRGEGWGYGPHMAAALGKQVIYTDYSATAEFMKAFEGEANPVAVSEMIVAAGSNVPYFQVMPGEAPLMWAQPNLNDAIEQMRDLVGNSFERVIVKESPYSWESVGERFVQIINQYETK